MTLIFLILMVFTLSRVTESSSLFGSDAMLDFEHILQKYWTYNSTKDIEKTLEAPVKKLFMKSMLQSNGSLVTQECYKAYKALSIPEIETCKFL